MADHSFLVELIAALPKDYECRTHRDKCQHDQTDCDEFFRDDESAHETLHELIDLARNQIALEYKEQRIEL